MTLAILSEWLSDHRCSVCWRWSGPSPLCRKHRREASASKEPIQRIDITIWPNDPIAPRVRAHTHRTDDGSDEPEEMI